MFSSALNSILQYPKALSFVFEHKLQKHFLISGLLSLLIGAITFGGAYLLADDAGSLLSNLYPFEWGKQWFYKFSTIISGIVMAGAGIFLYKYLILIFIGPFMGPLSAKVENIIVGPAHQGKFSIKNTAYEIVRGIRVSARNITRELFFSFIIVLVGFIPIFSFFTSPLLFLVQANYAGFGNMDYTMERHLSVKQSVKYVRANRGSAIGNGLGFLLMLFIPIIGLFVAPVLGTVAATMDNCEKIVEGKSLEGQIV